MHQSLLVSVAITITACSVGTDFTCRDRPTDPLCAIDGASDGGASDTGLVDGGADTGPIDAFSYPCGHACAGTTPFCDMSSRICVGCLAASDCTTAAAPRCDTTTTHACAPCMTDGDCSQITGAHACNMGMCVACTAANESACGANSCDPMTNACTTTPRMSVGTCHACIADSECMGAMDRCVPMQFMSAAHGSYCLRQMSAGCMRPYAIPTAARSSTSGAAASPYCGIDETTASCEAVNALLAATGCTTDMSCNAPGALCRAVGGIANQCTYACAMASQCPGVDTCGAGTCGS